MQSLIIAPAIRRATAQILIKTGCIVIDTRQPFTDQNGHQHPIRFNIQPLSNFPIERRRLMDMAADILHRQKPTLLIAGESDVISLSAMIADRLDLPHAALRPDRPCRGLGSSTSWIIERTGAPLPPGTHTAVLYAAASTRETTTPAQTGALAAAGIGAPATTLALIADTATHPENALTNLREVVEVAYLSGYVDSITRAALDLYLADQTAWVAPFGRAANHPQSG